MIIIRPSSGLCNRLRAIASGVRLAQECGEELLIDWYYCPIKRWAPLLGMAIPYSLLFLNVDEFKIVNHLRVKYEMPWDKCFWESDRADIFSEKHSKEFISKCRETASDGRNKRLWTCYNFYASTDYSWLRPRKEVVDSVSAFCSRFSSNTIGMHIRRTDNTWSIQHSPLELFTSTIEKEIDNDRNVRVFVATDSEEVRMDLLRRYKGYIITRPNVSPRYTLKGEYDGLVDLLILSKTRKIYGSFRSSFSEVASHIGCCDLKILNRV